MMLSDIPLPFLVNIVPFVIYARVQVLSKISLCINLSLWLLRQPHVGAGDLFSWLSTLRGASDKSFAGVRRRLIATDFRVF